MLQAVLVGLTVIILEFVETWFSYPMTTRPFIVGTAIGIVLGDITTGVIVGAALELVFMGVMAIGGTVPPDAVAGTAVGTAFAIILGQGTETAFALAVPVSILCQMMFVPLVALRSLWSPMIDRMVESGNYKALERMVPFVSLTFYIPKGIICGAAVALGSTVMQGVIDSLPTVLLDGMGVAAGMLAAVGFALLLKMMLTKKLAVYYILGFVLATYCGLPLMAIATLGIILVIILYFEGSFSKNNKKEVVASGEEELFND
ncbi:PTS mannose/fructose/sorbose/N-acetylgalactosamine transporter subunit IIC [Anaerorhabdus sp.]|uniref:PTS mannose/fructose/sorbose/N-acetylgalactosamine transporter subunit IIC n=1 Tax=Anaerorhabdus sp. TaxID=1872524 RepID=UPI002B211670|nr:PTS sugar transporter subunit IIC [Anaerorhabdus sp.]MEA4874466.1 PTS sugar transporter subunit IIC [Anaerorhabdus sp.]